MDVYDLEGQDLNLQARERVPMNVDLRVRAVELVLPFDQELGLFRVPGGRT